MLSTLKMPKVGDAVDEVVIREIKVERGATVNKGDTLFVVETDKAQVEVPAPAAGVVSNILIAVGDDVKTGAPTSCSISSRIAEWTNRIKGSQMAKIWTRQAVLRALDDAMSDDPTVILMGEDVAEAGGPFKVTEGLLAKHGPERVIDTPISEMAFMGAAVGAAVCGSEACRRNHVH